MLAAQPKFTICVSEQKFEQKLEKNDNRWGAIRFQPQTVSVREMLSLAIEGRVFCGTFKSDNEDGSFCIKQKTKENFTSSSTIFFDIDGSDYPMEEYINRLDYKPSFAYTTYNNREHGNRFRLGYVFNRELNGEDYFNKMYYAIAKANGFQEELDKLPCAQCYLGTIPFADTYQSDYIYSHYDFDKYVVESVPSVKQTPIFTTSVSIEIDKTFLHDFNNLKFNDFFEKYKERYYKNYRLSVSPELLLDESKMFYTYPSNYHCVIHKAKGRKQFKWSIGNDRKEKIFMTVQIMLANNPSLSIENILYGLRIEREWYYMNTDNKISNTVLIEKAKYCLQNRYSIPETEHPSFKVNKSFWKEQGVTVMQAVNHICYELRVRKVRLYYNPSLTYQENHDILKDNGISVSIRTLKRMVARGDIGIIDNETHNTILSCCRSDVTNPTTKEIIKLIKCDRNITQKEMAEILQCDVRTIKRYTDEMKGVLIERIGNNRSGYWIVK